MFVMGGVRQVPMNVRSWLTVVWLFGAATITAHVQSPATKPDAWEPEIRAFEEADRQLRPAVGGVVFVGSSSIRRWESLERDFPGVPVLNRGFGGSEMDDVVRFADRLIYPYQPRLVVVYAGDNDLANGKSPEQVVDAARRLAEQVRRRLPETRVAFISIKPSLARWNLVDRMRSCNEKLRSMASHDPRLSYIDVFTPMIGADGRPRRELFVEDGLHLTSQGYELWKSVIGPYLN
jgi:lysophospholipase L1-like esterase